jgi:hypothetical protein
LLSISFDSTHYPSLKIPIPNICNSLYKKRINKKRKISVVLISRRPTFSDFSAADLSLLIFFRGALSPSTRRLLPQTIVVLSALCPAPTRPLHWRPAALLCLALTLRVDLLAVCPSVGHSSLLALQLALAVTPCSLFAACRCSSHGAPLSLVPSLRAPPSRRPLLAMAAEPDPTVCSPGHKLALLARALISIHGYCHLSALALLEEMPSLEQPSSCCDTCVRHSPHAVVFVFRQPRRDIVKPCPLSSCSPCCSTIELYLCGIAIVHMDVKGSESSM